MRPGYKQTEIGVIPEDWEIVNLRSCLSSHPDYGLNAPAVSYSDQLPKYLRITDITDDGRISKSNPVSVRNPDANSYYLKEGDIVFARTGASVGKSYKYCLEDGPLVFAGFLIRIHPNELNLNAQFFAEYVQTFSYWHWVKIMSMRSGQPGINGNEFAMMTIPKPKIKEQRQISTVLKDVKNLLYALDQLIAKKRDLKQAAMQQLLTGKTRLPGFEGGWEVKTLATIVDYTNGKAHEQSITDFGKFTVVNSKFISTEGIVRKYSENCFCPARKNDVLMVMSDVPNGKAIAKCFWVEIENRYTVNQRICALNPKEIDGKLLFYKLNRNPYYLAFDDGVKQTNLLKEDVLSLPLSIPKSKDEQTAIASILSDMDYEITALEQRRAKTADLKQAMMQELLTGKTRLVKAGASNA